MNIVYVTGRYIWFFLIYSLFGAIVETIFRLITEHQLYGIHGFLHIPIFPIYGIGALLVIALFQHHVRHVVPLFFAGAILTTVLEFITHLLIEIVFNERIWDYSNTPFNVDGRISLYSSIGFGVAAVALVHFIHPRLNKLFDRLPNRVNVVITVITVIVFSVLLIDTILSVIERIAN